ncbi:MAG: heparinase II/III family protein [Lentisphaerae bacterium]|nr:heparinase II/III family protein [Lentisphaerota bacterium]
MLFTPTLLETLRRNVQRDPWCARMATLAIADAQPWLARADEELWSLMYGPTLTRSWNVWTSGHCPACKGPVPLYNWIINGLTQPWKVLCPHCQETFPKNDFYAFYQSGLDAQGVFSPALAKRELLFNAEHPDPADPLHRFCVDDGEGYVESGKRWRFIGTYLIYGQWKHLVLGGIRCLANAYAISGEKAYAHKAAVLLDRVADLYPSFDHIRQAWVHEIYRTEGYVSTWHDACEETRQMALAYAVIRPALLHDQELADFLEGQRRAFSLARSKATPADICRNIEDGLLRDPLQNPRKIYSNYPRREIALAVLHAALDWPGNRATVLRMADEMVARGTAVDGLTGEKGLAGYSAYVIQSLAQFLALLEMIEPGSLADLLRRHPALRQTWRFHLDTWCMDRQFYPRVGDTGWFCGKVTNYAGVVFRRGPDESLPEGSATSVKSTQPVCDVLTPSMFSFLWRLSELTGDDYSHVLLQAGGGRTKDLPYDFFHPDPEAFRRAFAARLPRTPGEAGNVNKPIWNLAILRSGQGAREHAFWLHYGSGGTHGHTDPLNLGLFAKGLDLMPDLGYPPLQVADRERVHWYLQPAAHNTVVVDNAMRPGWGPRLQGACRLWADGHSVAAISAACPEALLDGWLHTPAKCRAPGYGAIGLYLHAPGRVRAVRVLVQHPEIPPPMWRLAFEDHFQREALGADWRVAEGQWRIEDGWLIGQGVLVLNRCFGGDVRLEFEGRAATAQPCDLSAFLLAQAPDWGDHDGDDKTDPNAFQRSAVWATGVFFGFGSDNNRGSKILVHGLKAGQTGDRIRPDAAHQIACECVGDTLRHEVDGQIIQSVDNTPDGVRALRALALAPARFERTVVRVDVSPEDSYALDVFRVQGGRDHVKFVHGACGTLVVSGLRLAPAPSYGQLSTMRNFQVDSAPAPGWSTDWAMEDIFRYLPPGADIHLRYTDFTTGAEVSTCEAWAIAGHYNATEERWFPRVLVHHRAEHEPLATTFVGVLEPYANQRVLAGIRRLALHAADGAALDDRHAAIEATLADGRRDLLLTLDTDAPTRDGFVAQREWEVETDAELAVLRRDERGRPQMVALARATRFKAEYLAIELAARIEFIELEIEGNALRVVTGDPAAIRSATLAGRPLRSA